MKLSFIKGDAPQAPVKAVQADNKKARPRTYPILTWLLRVVAAAAPITLIALWWSSRHIHAYGVVSAHVETLAAPIRSRLEAVYVEIGDRVRAGDTLYVLTSDDARAELAGADAELARARAAAAALLGERPSRPPGSGTDADSRTLAAGTAAPPASDGAAVASDADASDPDRVIASAEAELTRATTRHATATRRLDEVRRLLALDAATAADERAAVAAERDADLQERMATLALERARRAATDARAQAAARVADLEARCAHLRELAGPTEVRALADGVIQDVAIGPGSTVAADAPIMSVIDAGSLWIDTYVPAAKATTLAATTVATVYPAVGASRQGTFTLDGAQEVRLPLQLREYMPRESSGVRLRVQVDDPRGFTPGSVARVTLR